jgi:hypothetical protein
MRIKNLVEVGQLPSRDRRIFLSSLILLPAIHFALLLLGYYRLRALMEVVIYPKQNGKYITGENMTIRAQEIARLVNMASEHGIYRPSCLRRSIAVWGFVRSEEIPAEIIFGVRPLNGQLEAHAWVECNSQVVNDEPDVGNVYWKLVEYVPRMKIGL